MRTILTEDHGSDVAIIRTIAKPVEITTFDDMADYRLLMKKMDTPEGSGFVAINFQFDMLVPPTADKRLAEMRAEQIYAALMRHTRTNAFRKIHGNLEIPREVAGSKPQRIRLREALIRITHYYNMPSTIKSCRRQIEGANIVEARLKRGVNIRCVDKRLCDEIESSTRPINGVLTLSGQDYVFYVWRPNSVNLLDVPEAVFKAEFLQEIQTAFPFFDTSALNMHFDLMPEKTFIAVDSFNNQQ